MVRAASVLLILMPPRVASVLSIEDDIRVEVSLVATETR